MEVNIKNLEEGRIYIFFPVNLPEKKVRITGISGRTLYLQPLNKEFQPVGSEEKYTFDELNGAKFFSDETILQTFSAPVKKNNQPVFIGCAADMEVVHQLSGQCWNDASVALLWLASGVGPIVQQRLQEPLENLIQGEALAWWESREIRAQLFSLFPYLIDNTSLNPLSYYDKLREDYFFYIGKMKERYELWRSLSGPRIKLRGTRERSLSGNLSASMEERGIRSSNILFYDPEISSRYTPGLCRIVKEAAGNNPNKFTNFLYLILHILLQGNIKLLVYRDDQTQYYPAILRQQHVPVIIHNPFNLKYQQIHDYYTPIHLASVIQRIDTDFNISMIATIKALYKQGNHAVLFLTCPSGQHYFFDDNDSRLISIEWPDLFKDYTNYTRIYYLQNVQQDVNLGRGIFQNAEIDIIIPVNERAVFIRFDPYEETLRVKTTDGEVLYTQASTNYNTIENAIINQYSYKFLSISTMLVDPKKNPKETKNSIQSFSLLDAKGNSLNKTAFNFMENTKNIKTVVRENVNAILRKPTEILKMDKKSRGLNLLPLESSNENSVRSASLILQYPLSTTPPANVPSPTEVPASIPVVSTTPSSYNKKKKKLDKQKSISAIDEAMYAAIETDDVETVDIIMKNLLSYIVKGKDFAYSTSKQRLQDGLNKRIGYFQEAILKGKRDAAELIFSLSKGNQAIDIHHKEDNENKDIFLAYAVLSGNIAVVQFLIDQGINVKANDTSTSMRALNLVADRMEENEENEEEFKKYLNIARLLVQNGVNNKKLSSEYKGKTRKAILNIQAGGRRKTRKNKSQHRNTRKNK